MYLSFPAPRRTVVLLLLVLLGSAAPATFAQKREPPASSDLALVGNRKSLTMAEAVLGRGLMPQNLPQLAWRGNTDRYAYVRGEGDQAELMTAAPDDKKETVLLDLKAFRRVLKAADAPGADNATFAGTRWLPDGQALLVEAGTALLRLDPKTGKATRVANWPEAADNVEADLTGAHVAYTNGQNLFISGGGADNVAVTTEANPAIVNGQAAHRSEFGITKGTFWSESGQKLAYYRMDQTMVTDYPLVDINPLPAQGKAIKYPMAGGTSHHVTVGIYEVTTKKTIFLQTGEPVEQYLTNITWAPDEKSIYVAVVNRAQNETSVRQYDAVTGAFLKTLFEEKDAKYSEPEHGLYFVPKHPDQFIWLSRRDGFRHAYLYATSGKLLRQLTKGQWEVTDLQGFDAKGQRAFYTATAESALERHTYAVSLSGGDSQRLTQGTGTHVTQVGNDGQWLLDNFSSTITPRTVRVIDATSGKFKKLLLSAPDPTAAYALGETRLFTIKAADGQTDLFCRMILPVNFDASKKYPAVIYVYGGPHVQLVTESWLGGGNLWMHLMAEKGYVVFTVDSRGSGNRGLAFEQATFRQLGTQEMADQLKGVDYLRAQPFVDPARIGVHGWSFGGFMTTTLLTRTPAHTFKAGVAGGPVIDWKFYEVMYTERYMDTPQENPDGYRTASLLNYVPNLKDKLLMIHGTVDDVVVWQQSLSYLKKCVDEGIQLDYFVYPGHPHNVRGKDRIHLMQKVTEYFDANL